MAAPIAFKTIPNRILQSGCSTRHFGGIVASLKSYNTQNCCVRHKIPSKCTVVPNHRVQFSAYSASELRRSRRLDVPKRSQEFIANLRCRERETLLAELIKFQNSRGQVVTSTEVPSEDTQPEVKSIPTPTSQQLRLVAFSNAIPFIGFGFFDNAIMIIAGDYIDVTIGATLSISTMAAAGLGNLISDVAGIGLAGTVEAAVSKVGVQVPVLTPEQQDLTRTRWTAGIARALGISIGCLIGMFPLLFLATKEDLEEEEHEKEVKSKEEENP